MKSENRDIVKNYNWKKIIFEDRTILKSDTKYFSWDQIRSLENMTVLEVLDKGKTLVVEKR